MKFSLWSEFRLMTTAFLMIALLGVIPKQHPEGLFLRQTLHEMLVAWENIIRGKGVS